MTPADMQAIHDLLFDDYEWERIYEGTPPVRVRAYARPELPPFYGDPRVQTEIESAILARLDAAGRRSEGGGRAHRDPAVFAAADMGVDGIKIGITDVGFDAVSNTLDGRPWMQSYNGYGVPLVDTTPDDIRWADIISGLAYNNRFAGAAGCYSVAQHCCVVADILPPEWRPYGLLHDAHEAYIGDITRPAVLAIMQHSIVPNAIKRAIHKLKATLDRAIFAKAGLLYPWPVMISEAVHIADERAMMTERRDLMRAPPYSWGHYEGVAPLPDRIERWEPSQAMWEFYDRLQKCGVFV